MRSGTSAMMSALVAGGMDGEWSQERNAIAMNCSDDSYKMNPDGLYEVPLKEYHEVDFPLKYQGKLIKVMVWGLETLSVNPEGYKIILMKRDKEEIRQSCEASLETDVRTNPFWKDYENRMIRVENSMRNRKDVLDLKVIRYREDLIENTESTLSQLAESVPFNHTLAVPVIQKDLCRFKLENLTIGI